MFDKILLPVDGSNASDRAAHVASDLASRYGAEIIVLNVPEYELLYGVEAAAEGIQDAADLVDRYVRRMKDAGLNARGEVASALHGGTGREILAVADHENVHLVVMGTHGLSPWRRLVLGSVTNKVLHSARVPVLVVQ